MGTRKSTRARKARVSNATKRPDERYEAAQVLIENGQHDSVNGMFFCEDNRSLPIVGPRPRPCPFCSKTDVMLVIEDKRDGAGAAYVSVHASCTVCGAEAPAALSSVEEHSSAYGLVLKAANYWNGKVLP
jgi:hypothetical protein